MAFLSLIFVVEILYIPLLTTSEGLSRCMFSVDIVTGCPTLSKMLSGSVQEEAPSGGLAV